MKIYCVLNELKEYGCNMEKIIFDQFIKNNQIRQKY